MNELELPYVRRRYRVSTWLARTLIKKTPLELARQVVPERAKCFSNLSLSRADFYPQVVQLLQEASDDLRFMIVGAHDGRRNDPLYPSLNPKKVRGILLEPQPFYFSKVCEAYAGFPEVKCLQKAFHPLKSQMTLHFLDPSQFDVETPEFAGGIASFDVDTFLAHRSLIPRFDAMRCEKLVDCVGFGELLPMLDNRLDVLQVDVEGFDWEVLKTFPFDATKPWVVHFESKHLSDSDFNNSVTCLSAHGYSFVFTQFDTIAFRHVLKSHSA